MACIACLLLVSSRCIVLVCAEQPSDGEAPVAQVWYCSKAEFCNWTNNPTMITKTWWRNEYESKFPVRV